MSDGPGASVIQRYHALDRLRAVMMLLGVVRHAAISYDPTVIEGWPYKDAHTDILAHWVIAFIRVFQLPVFFLVAGFFAAYLVDTRGVRAFLSHRWSRLGVPLLVAWPVLAVSTYVIFRVAGPLSSVPPTHSLVEVMSSTRTLDYILMHLWFLYYLLILSLAAGGVQILAWRIPEAVRERLLELFARHLMGGVLVVAILIGGIVLYQMQSWTIDYHGGVIPAPRLLALYSVLFGFGWLLFCRREALKGFMGPAWLFLAGATASFLVHRYFVDTGCGADIALRCTGTSELHHLGAVAFLSLSMWLMAYGLIGVFMRHVDRPSPRWRYMADASYWTYLVHLPVVMLLPLVISSLPLPAMVKLALVVAAATGLILLAYHYFVRSTFIGNQLNGRRHLQAAT